MRLGLSDVNYQLIDLALSMVSGTNSSTLYTPINNYENQININVRLIFIFIAKITASNALAVAMVELQLFILKNNIIKLLFILFFQKICKLLFY